MWPQNKKQEIFREQKQKTNAFRDAADDGSVSGFGVRPVRRRKARNRMPVRLLATMPVFA